MLLAKAPFRHICRLVREKKLRAPGELFSSDRREDLRHLFSPRAPERLPEHEEILDQLWPKGDKSKIYSKTIPALAERELYRSIVLDVQQDPLRKRITKIDDRKSALWAS